MVSKISNYFCINIIHELCAIRPFDCRGLSAGSSFVRCVYIIKSFDKTQLHIARELTFACDISIYFRHCDTDFDHADRDHDTLHKELPFVSLVSFTPRGCIKTWWAF